MTTARYTQIDLKATPYYHCISRCVRRAYLYGKDIVTGKDYSYRKQMIVAKLKQLAAIFTIDICAYAVMSNHTHLVLHVNLPLAELSSEREIRQRWSMLCPKDYQAFTLVEASLTIDQVANQINKWRTRLCSISEFMAHLNYSIARKCNLEDNCKGRFWEGRFKSQALLDEGALLSAMVYVDLNPIRANTAVTPEQSEFTSIYERIKYLKQQFDEQGLKQLSSKSIDAAPQPEHLSKLGQANDISHFIDFKLSDYLQLIDLTGRILRLDKPGKIPNELIPILERLQLTPQGWINLTTNPIKNFSRAIGQFEKMLAFNFNKTSKIRGINKSKSYYRQAA